MSNHASDIRTGVSPGDVVRYYLDFEGTHLGLAETHDDPDGTTLCGSPYRSRPFPLVREDETVEERFEECDAYVYARDDMCPECRRVYFGSDEDGASWRERLAEIGIEREAAADAGGEQ